MSDEIWEAVDRFVTERVVRPPAETEAALAAGEAAGLPAIDVTAAEGRLLELLARTQGARTILELGTLGGYSTIWLARALPADGRLISLEAVPSHAEVARASVTAAGLAGVVDIRVGRALDTLPGVVADGPFDLVFVDADKQSTAEYFAWALELTRPGSLIVVDNVIRDGRVLDAGTGDPSVDGVRRFYDAMAAEPRVTATVIQSVGAKGYDGFALARVND